MTDILILCSLPDETFAMELGDRFQKTYSASHYAVDRVPDGQIPNAIVEQVQWSKVIIVVISQFTKESVNFNWMLDTAVNSDRPLGQVQRVVPLVQAGVAVPRILYDVQPVTFPEYNAFRISLQPLEERIRSIMIGLQEEHSDTKADNIVQRKDEETKQQSSRPQKASKKATPSFSRERIVQLQKDLTALGFKVIADGVVGQQTNEALFKFQKDNGLELTGRPDEGTLEMIEELKSRQSQADKSPAYWVLALEDLGLEPIRQGVTFEYPSSEEPARNVVHGNLLIGCDLSNGNKAVGVFRAGESIITQGTQGIVLRLTVEEVFASPVDLSGLDGVPAFLNRLTSNDARLYTILEPVFNKIVTVGRQPLHSQSKAQPPRSLLHSAAARLHSDDSEPEDQLQYEMYAEAIASIIRDSKTSPPPLNIAIIAPWGQGKTTLMRYIRKRFEKNVPAEEVSSATHLTFGALWSWFGSSYKWVQKLKNLFVKDGVDPVLEELRKGKWKPQSLQHPTVWFNPWRYQSSDQIWAGLGHAMITQLVAKLNPVQREQFWLSLRLKRIDGNAIRRDIHRRIFESLVPVLIGGVLLAGVLIAGVAFNAFAGLDWFIKWLIGGGSIAMFALACFTNVRNFFSKSLEGKFATYVREPDYEGKLGLFHEINHDLSKVCNELISKEHPAIIFIDDLDRCSPKVVTEVIEAINLMMTSDFRSKCYFVFGMDAQMVSAALDAQYSSMAGKFADKEKIHGSVGWYFLDKFIQLPFFIPVLNPDDKKKFLNRFFFAPVEPEKKQEVKNITEKEVEADAAEAVENVQKREANTKKYEADPIAYQSAVVKKLMERSKDSTEIAAEVIKYAEYLDGSPRGLKRFANLLRFYHTQQQMRMHYTTSAMQGSTATTSSLAKWLVINLRWPQMVRWVQWEYEELFLYSSEPEVKAKHIDDLIKKLDTELATGEDAYTKWLELLGEKDEQEKKKNAHLKWLRDRDLFLLLHQNKGEDSSLENALHYDVW